MHSSPHASPLLQGLNNEQAAAVTLPQTHALILAGAGSGKTRVLTTRIAWLMQTGQVSPGGLLAVTFTNKAAKEMLTRLSAMLPVNVRGMWVGTFHGLCNRFLRAHWKLANLSQTFQILDTQDQLSAIKRLSKQFQVDDERFPPKQTMRFIAACKEDGLRPKDVVVRDPDDRKRVELYELYEIQCQREGVVDFGELMLRSYELLRDNDTPERLLMTKQIGQTVNAAMEALPEELRTAISLREIEGLSYEEIAQVMDCPIGTVRSRIFRARDAISVKLRPLLDAAPDKRW